MRVSPRQLEVILAVAEDCGVSAAAKRLNLSQPAVTRYVREAEQSLGLQLFDRSSRGTQPTAAGIALLHRARAVAAELRALEYDAEALRGSSAGRLSVGVTPAVPSLVPRAVTKLLDASPNVAVEIIEEMRPRLLAALRAGELDLVLATQPSEGPGDGLIDRVLFQNRLSVVARWNHPLGGRSAIPAAELRNWPWVLPTPDLPPRVQLELAFRQSQVSPPQRIVSTNTSRMQREMVLSGDFLSVLVGEALHHDVRFELIRVLDVDLVLPLRPISLITRHSAAASPLLLRFIELLEQELSSDATSYGSEALADLRPRRSRRP